MRCLPMFSVLCTAVVGIDVGWQPLQEGGTEYIIQLDPQSLEALKAGQPIESDILPGAGEVRSFKFYLGDEKPRRIGSTAKPAQQRQANAQAERTPPSSLTENPVCSAVELPNRQPTGLPNQLPAELPSRSPANCQANNPLHCPPTGNRGDKSTPSHASSSLIQQPSHWPLRPRPTNRPALPDTSLPHKPGPRQTGKRRLNRGCRSFSCRWPCLPPSAAFKLYLAWIFADLHRYRN